MSIWNKRNGIFLVAIIIINIIFASLLWYFISQYFGSEITTREKDAFDDAKFFIEKGYPEIKALANQLLTLLTSILVFSITFSEKIVGFQSASADAKFSMFVSWGLILVAIILGGIGIAFNSFALPFALSDQVESSIGNYQSVEFYQVASKALFFILASGQLFVFGLLTMMIAAVRGYK